MGASEGPPKAPNARKRPGIAVALLDLALWLRSAVSLLDQLYAAKAAKGGTG